MNRAEARAEHIDPALAAAGWSAVEGSRVRCEFHITLSRLQDRGMRGKSEMADCVLEYRNTALAVVAAKAWGCSASRRRSVGCSTVFRGICIAGRLIELAYKW